MNRRDALTALGTLAGAAGLSVTPVTVKDAEHVALTVLRSDVVMTREGIENLKLAWERAMQGTALEGVRTFVLDRGVDVEFVRR